MTGSKPSKVELSPLLMLLLVVGGTGIGGRILLFIERHLHFAPRNPGGVISYITLSGYPAYLDVLYFYAGAGGLCAVAIAYALVWRVIAGALRSVPQGERVFNSFALAQTPLILFLGPWRWFLPPAVCALFFPLAWYLSNSLPDVKAVPFWSRKRSEPGLLSLVVIPILLYMVFVELKVNGLIDFYHEGERLVPLQVYLSGGLPFKDVYLQHGIGSNFLMPLLAAKFFEPTLEGVRFLFRILDPIAYVALYLFGLVFFRSGASIALLLVAIVSGDNFWLGFRQGIALAALAILLSAFRRLKREQAQLPWKLFFLSGFLMSLAVWYSLEIGLYVICASGGWFSLLLLTKREGRRFAKAFGFLLLGWFSLSVPVTAVLIKYGIFTDALRNIAEQVSYQSVLWGLPFASFAEAPKLYLPIAVYIITALFLCFRFLIGATDQFTKELLLVELSALVFFRTALGRSDYGHWIDGSVFLWILLLLPLDLFVSSIRKSSFAQAEFNRLGRVALAILSLLIIAYAHQAHDPLGAAGKRLKAFSLTLSGQGDKEMIPRAGKALIPKVQASIGNELLSYIDSEVREGEAFFDFTNQGAYYFFANRPPPSRYFQAIYAATVEQRQSVIRDLEQKSVTLVLFKTGTAFDAIDGVPQEVRQPEIFQYLQNNFCPDKTLGTAKFMKRCAAEQR